MTTRKKRADLATAIPIRLTTEQVKALRAKANELDIPMASLIRQAVREFLLK